MSRKKKTNNVKRNKAAAVQLVPAESESAPTKSAHDFYEHLKISGFHPNYDNHEKILDRIEALKPEQLIALAEDFSSRLSKKPAKRLGDFDFIANSTLGGGPFPCSEVACRLDNVQSLASFTGLYADRVLVEDPFGALVHISPEYQQAITNFLIGLIVVTRLEPLVTEGLIEFVDSRNIALCADCYTKIVKEAGPNFYVYLEKAHKSLEKDFKKNAKFTLEKIDGDGIHIHIEGPERLVSHGSMYMVGELKTKALKNFGKALPYKFDSKEMVKYGLFSRMITEPLHDLLVQNFFSIAYNASYLTNRETDLSILSDFASKSGAKGKPSVASHLLQHEIPFLPNLPVKTLIELRQKEGEAFTTYRDAVRLAVEQASRASAADAGTVVKDVILPEVNKIKKQIRDSKKLLLAGAVQDVLVGSDLTDFLHQAHC